MHAAAQPSGHERGGRERAATWILAAGALAVLLAALSTWGVGFLQDDWRLLARARAGAWVMPEPNHLSLPLGALWWAGDRTGSPLPARVSALLGHLVSYGLLLPALARALRPELPAAVGRQAGLLGLCAWVALDPLIWACAAAYALVLPCLLGATVLHLHGLEGRRGARAGSLLLLSLGLLTWELAVAGPALLALAGWARGRGAWPALRAALPACALLGLYVALKLAVESVEAPPPRGPLRLLLNLGATPLFLLWPLPWPRQPLLGPAGWAAVAMAWGALGLVVAAGRRREQLALLGMAVAPLLPLLPGPGPEARHLYLGLPFLALAVRLAMLEAEGAGPRARAAALPLLGVWVALSAGSAWAAAARWRAADRMARAVLDQAAALASDGAPLALVDVPDRLPGWGPCWKHPVWRLGLREALARRGVTLIGRAHRLPLDVETQGLSPSTPPLEPELLGGWGDARVLVADPAGDLRPLRPDERATPPR